MSGFLWAVVSSLCAFIAITAEPLFFVATIAAGFFALSEWGR